MGRVKSTKVSENNVLMKIKIIKYKMTMEFVPKRKEICRTNANAVPQVTQTPTDNFIVSHAECDMHGFKYLVLWLSSSMKFS
jgi:hypothetical protein